MLLLLYPLDERAGAGISSYTGMGPGYLELNEHRHFDVDRRALMVEHLDLHVLFQVVHTVPELFFVERYLLIRRGIHKNVVFIGAIEVLHGLFLKVRNVDLFTRADRLVGHVAGFQALELGPYERAAFSWLHLLELNDDIRLSVELYL